MVIALRWRRIGLAVIVVMLMRMVIGVVGVVMSVARSLLGRARTYEPPQGRGRDSDGEK